MRGEAGVNGVEMKLGSGLQYGYDFLDYGKPGESRIKEQIYIRVDQEL